MRDEFGSLRINTKVRVLGHHGYKGSSLPGSLNLSVKEGLCERLHSPPVRNVLMERRSVFFCVCAAGKR